MIRRPLVHRGHSDSTDREGSRRRDAALPRLTGGAGKILGFAIALLMPNATILARPRVRRGMPRLYAEGFGVLRRSGRAAVFDTSSFPPTTCRRIKFVDP